jgi:hypothetical protein
MKDINNYEDRSDKIFADGHLWQHRTFRTILDQLSSEWHQMSIEMKIKIQSILRLHINL